MNPRTHRRDSPPIHGETIPNFLVTTLWDKKWPDLYVLAHIPGAPGQQHGQRSCGGADQQIITLQGRRLGGRRGRVGPWRHRRRFPPGPGRPRAQEAHVVGHGEVLVEAAGVAEQTWPAGGPHADRRRSTPSTEAFVDHRTRPCAGPQDGGLAGAVRTLAATITAATSRSTPARVESARGGRPHR